MLEKTLEIYEEKCENAVGLLVIGDLGEVGEYPLQV